MRTVQREIIPAIISSGRMTQKEYDNIHYWVRSQLGTPKRCDFCGDTSRKYYDWANISQEYKRELSDWRRLCRSCHRRENNLGHCKNGHEAIPENIYYVKTGPFKGMVNYCIPCHKISLKKYALKKKQAKTIDACIALIEKGEMW